ncbi:MAG: 30S ribosomal protein S12 methylthiotransferase RimO [Candidatus Omnitrophota bacterium]|nr:30S ribosomal protein S12 methylthiotransferase RimO [Candidatus Omnitrophota bacterium]
MIKVGIISLGCARNLLDSEVIAGSLKKQGLKIAGVGSGVDICVINTCSFTGQAREESVDAILEISQLKKEGRIKRIVVCGCLPQLYKEKLIDELPEVDLFLGSSDFPELPRLIKNLKGGKPRSHVSRAPNYLYSENTPRYMMTPSHYAYVKVSEGCCNHCSYCIIPRLRGTFRSRPINSVINEIKKLSVSGTLKEVNLIGQDTTLFGYDRYGKKRLPAGSKTFAWQAGLEELLRRVCALKNSVEWIRILYTHPAHYTNGLISAISEEEKICKYLDLPIQHISDKVLKSMNRRTTGADISRLIEKLRKDIRGLVLRTSIIVGFPGETDRDFEELTAFMKETAFERCGAFIYSREEGTAAAKMKGQVPESVKRERFDCLMKLQQRISLSKNKRLIGRTVKVLIDDKTEGEKDIFEGRTQGDAPEVDGVAHVSGKNVKVGGFCDVRITEALEYDLVGKKV